MQLSEATLNNSKAGGDIFDAISFMIDKIADHCKAKKYNKRAFLFTNGMGETSYGVKDLNRIVDRLKQNGIKLNIIPLDFMENYDMDENTMEGDVYIEPIQEKNSALLMKLRSLEF